MDSKYNFIFNQKVIKLKPKDDRDVRRDKFTKIKNKLKV